MTQWYSKKLGDGVAAYKPTIAIQEAFLPIFAAAGQPIDMAVFSQYNVKEKIVIAYFSPSAHVLAQMLDAVPCNKPKKENDLSLIAGDAKCWELFYPSHS